MTAPELARELKLDPKRLRQIIRDHRLVPSHQDDTHYDLDPDEVARIKNHPAVQAAIAKRRAR